MNYDTKALFAKAALIRAVKTFAQAMVAQIGAGSIGITQFDWGTALSISAMAAVLSIFTSLAGLPEVEYAQHIHMSKDEPEDSEVEDYEVYDYGEEEEEGELNED